MRLYPCVLRPGSAQTVLPYFCVLSRDHEELPSIIALLSVTGTNSKTWRFRCPSITQGHGVLCYGLQSGGYSGCTTCVLRQSLSTSSRQGNPGVPGTDALRTSTADALISGSEGSSYAPGLANSA